MVDQIKIEEILIQDLDMWSDDNEEHITRNTFNDIGLLTNNNGIILDIDGSEFQITIVQSG